ncbi:HYC_CC_PP family protein [Flavobacterium oreochromis]|uniref:HYC_CC_PP family protein n=1 Tax=Flavobacterium oreochromis TaxID=2906078 RepID=UPI00403FFBBD
MRLRNIVNTCLALLVLISNTGLAINVHYCGEVIAAITFDNLKKIVLQAVVGIK